jgi:predicted DCC family thiol-disulfide oxidoreductase YuxK
MSAATGQLPGSGLAHVPRAGDPGPGRAAAAPPLPVVPRIDFGGPTELPRPALRRDGRSRLIVLYDRDCGLCTATARALRRWDRHGRLRMLSLQDARQSDRSDLADAVGGLPLTAALHVVDEATGMIRVGGDAALAIGRALPGGRVVAVLGRIAPFRVAVRLGYDLVARHRRRIGRLLRLEGPACELPR